MRDVLLVGMGGFLGAILRFAAAGAVHQIPQAFDFPYGTLVVNVVGSFVLAFLAYLADALGLFGPSFRFFAFIGLLGAFTTFSTFSLETSFLLLDGEGWLAGLNVAANFGLCLVAVFTVRAIVLWIWS